MLFHEHNSQGQTTLTFAAQVVEIKYAAFLHLRESHLKQQINTEASYKDSCHQVLPAEWQISTLAFMLGHNPLKYRTA